MVLGSKGKHEGKTWVLMADVWKTTPMWCIRTAKLAPFKSAVKIPRFQKGGVFTRISQELRISGGHHCLLSPTYTPKGFIYSGQIIATSHDGFPPNGGDCKENLRKFQGNLGWWNITIWWDMVDLPTRSYKDVLMNVSLFRGFKRHPCELFLWSISSTCFFNWQGGPLPVICTVI